MEEGFNIGDVVEFGEKMQTGEVVAVHGDECTIEYFNNGQLTTTKISNDQIFLKDDNN